MTNELETRKENLPDNPYAEYAAAGFGEADATELQIPFIGLLQALSPEVQDGEEEYIEGAKSGLFIDTASKELIGKEFYFTPAIRERAIVEWVPRKQGGGFVARYDINDPKIQALPRDSRFGPTTNPETGNDLVDTTYVFGVREAEDGSLEPAILSFWSTKIKVWRNWRRAMERFRINGVQPPMFAHRVRVTSKLEKNAIGQVFYNYTILPANGDLADSLLSPDDPRFQAAKELHDSVKSGFAKPADQETAEPVEEDDNSDEVFA